MKYILIILLFASCNATKQAAKHLDKAFKKDADYVAKVTRDSFPCTELLRTDTAFVFTDSTVYINCPDYESKTIHDTMRSQIVTTKYIKVPVKLPIKTIYINRWYEDSTKIFMAERRTAAATKDGEKWKGKLKRSRNANLWFIVSIVGLIAALVLLIRSKLK